MTGRGAQSGGRCSSGVRARRDAGGMSLAARGGISEKQA